MYRTLKVFCTGDEQDRLAERYNAIERYQGFMLVEVPEEIITEIDRQYPSEDITDLYTLRIGDRSIDTSQPRMDVKGKLRSHPAYRGVKRLSSGPHHHLIQFIGPVKAEWLQEIQKIGGEPRTPQASFAYIVRADEKTLSRITALPFVRWAGHLSHNDRIASSVIARRSRKSDEGITELPRTRLMPDAYTVEFFSARDMTAALPGIKKLGFDILSRDSKAALAVIKDVKTRVAPLKRMQNLAAIHGVRFIRERAFKRTSNDVAERIMGTRTAMGTDGLGLSGSGEVIAVCDTGIDTADPQSIHKDFSGRIKKIISYPITSDFSDYINNPAADDGAADYDSGHGTHVAGSVLGNGSASLDISSQTTPIRGLSHKARLLFQAIEQEMQWKNPAYYQSYGRYLLSGIPLDLRTLFADAYAEGARIHSNSWGGGTPGEYDSQCEQLDGFVWEHKDFCVLVAAGNDGTDQDGDGKINEMSVTSPATAKNCITVGASENERGTFSINTYGAWWPSDYPVAPYRNDPMADSSEQVAAFSSRGPTQDGRIKPDVVTPGTFILSTRSTMIAANNTAWAAFPASRLYFYMGGTSMATPLTAGALGLIREFLRKNKGLKKPSAALLKAIIIAGARRISGHDLPDGVLDYNQGYGRVNLDAVLSPSSPAETVFLDIAPGLQTGEIHTESIEVKSAEAPLRVVLAYSDYPGPSLVNNLNLIMFAPGGSRHVGNQAPGSTLTMDVKNNVEVIHIPSPEPGSWELQVVGSNIPHGPQDFALVWLADLGEATNSDTIFAETAPELAIPDNNLKGITSKINISQTGVIGNAKVGVNIRHTYIGDLRVTLTAPDRTDVILHNRTGASADDLVATYDAHTTPNLAQLKDKSVTGDWTLTVSDRAGIDTGILHSWNVSIALTAADKIEKEKVSALPIPDNDPDGISDTIHINATGNIHTIQVWLDITHTWIGDLRVNLVPPVGDQIILHDRGGGNQDNLIKTYSQETVPALTALIGRQAQGTWTLQVVDLAGRDIGKLNRWGLRIML